MSDDVAIKIENLSKKYVLRRGTTDADGVATNELWALKNVSLEIKKGESIGIFGANGSGKSTLLKILAGVTAPTTGKVTINGRVASILDIGAGFHPDLSGRDNIYLNGQLLGFNKREITQKLAEIIAFSGIEKFVDEPVKTYSNGMYLRLAFSIMAHLDFDIYLFDEVLSVGDADFSMKTKRIFENLINSGKTILVVSHNMNNLYQQHKYVYLEKGEVKDASQQKSILSKYFDNAIASSSHQYRIVDRHFTLSDPKQLKSSQFVKIHRVEIYQDLQMDEPFYTDRPFHFVIEYEKLGMGYTVDPILSIADTQGNIILSSPPFLTQDFSQETGPHRAVAKCGIPANFFNSQIYQLDLYFLKDVSEVALIMTNVLLFKPVFRRRDARFDMAKSNLPSFLIPELDWETGVLPND